MPRHNLTDIRLTLDLAFWPSNAATDPSGQSFEAVINGHAEDTERTKSTLNVIDAARHLHLFPARAARRLIKRLESMASGKKTPQSMASSAHMRRVRNRIFSQIWRLASKSAARTTTFTAIKRGWEFKPEQLGDVVLEKLLNGFLSDLNRRGAGDADGWLIAFIHGEFETPANIYRLHVHGIASGEMIGVVDSLRHGRKYKFKSGDSVRFRVRIDRKALTNLPYPLTYCFKAYWPWKHVIIGANGKRRTRRHRRIREPYHTQVLVFFDQRTPSDFVVFKHLTVRKGQLKPTRKKK